MIMIRVYNLVRVYIRTQLTIVACNCLGSFNDQAINLSVRRASTGGIQLHGGGRKSSEFCNLMIMLGHTESEWSERLFRRPVEK